MTERYQRIEVDAVLSTEKGDDLVHLHPTPARALRVHPPEEEIA